MIKIRKFVILLLFLLTGLITYSAPQDSNGKQKDLEQIRAGIVAEAQKHLGKPYVWGATGTGSFDCSGFTQYVLKKNDLNVSRVARDQAKDTTQKLSMDQLKAGDLIFFKNPNPNSTNYELGQISHVGIYLGNGKFIHASMGGKKVMVSDLTGYYAKNFSHGASIANIANKNGYTGVNEIEGDGRDLSTEGSELVGMVETGYVVDFDGVLKLYTDAIKEGLNNFAQTLVVLLTYIAGLDFMYFYITTPNKNLENVFREFVVKLCKFFLFLLIIRNINNINEFAFKLCFDIAKVFVGEPKYLLNDVFEAYLVNCKSLLVFFSKINVLDLLSGQMTFKVVMIIGFIVILTFIFCMIMGQIVINLMNFFIGVNISSIFLPMRYSDYTKGYFPDPFGVIITNSLKLIVNIILITISLKIIGTRAIPDITVNDFDIAAIMCFIIYFGITAAVLFQVNKKIGNMI